MINYDMIEFLTVLGLRIDVRQVAQVLLHKSLHSAYRLSELLRHIGDSVAN